MPRKIQDVELPSVLPLRRRASSQSSRPRASTHRGGGRYKAGVVARTKVPRCREHANCAFTGREPDRCPTCHAFKDDEGCLGHESYPAGRTRPCLCAGCGELFSSPSAFGSHQRLVPEERGGGVRCLNPERRGLELQDRNGWMMWCAPGERPEI